MTDLRDWFDLMWRTSEQDFKRRREALDREFDTAMSRAVKSDDGKIMRGQTTGATVRFVREDSHTPPGA